MCLQTILLVPSSFLFSQKHKRETTFSQNKRGDQMIRNKSKRKKRGDRKKDAAGMERKRDKDREAETPGTDRQGCRERSLISQHHLFPVPGLKAPLMSNLPQPHTSRALSSRERPHCLFFFCRWHLFFFSTPKQQLPTHSHALQWH